MKALVRMLKMTACFLLALAATYFTSPSAQAAPAPQGGVDCTMQVRLCPDGTLSWDCFGDCAPFPEDCVLNVLGNWRWCSCRVAGEEHPTGRLAPCSLFLDISTLSHFCHNTDCLGSCNLVPIGYDANGCLIVRCVCQ